MVYFLVYNIHMKDQKWSSQNTREDYEGDMITEKKGILDLKVIQKQFMTPKAQAQVTKTG